MKFGELPVTDGGNFSQAVKSAFNGYKDVSPRSWFGSVLAELQEANNKPVDANKDLTEATENNTTSVDRLSEENRALNASIAGHSIDVNHLMEMDASQLEELGLDKTIIDQFKSVSNFSARMFNNAHEGYLEAEKLLKNLGGAHRQYLTDVQKYFGGTADLTRESHLGMSRDLIEAYKNVGQSVLMTNEELQDSPLLQADTSMFPDFISGEAGEVLKNQMNEYIRIVSDPQDAAKRFADLTIEFGKTYQEQFTGAFKDGTDMLELEVIVQSLGLESDQVSKIISRSIDRTGEASVQNFKDITKFAFAAEKETGVSAKIIVENMSDIISDVQRFGNVTEEEAVRIGTQLAQVGIEAETLGSLVSKFADFDTAANAVGNLTAAFGLNIDAMEMMMLANTDQEAFLMSMRDQFEEQGLAFEDMNLAQQKLLAGQLGIGIEEASRLFDFDQDVTSLEDLKAAQEDMPEEDAFSMLKQSALSFAMTGDDLQAKIERTNSFGIGSKMIEDVEMFRRKMRETEQAVKVGGARFQQEITTSTVGPIIKATQDADELLEKLKNKMNEIQGKKTEVDVAQGSKNAEVVGVAFSNQVKKDAPGIGKAIGSHIGPNIVVGVKPDTTEEYQIDEDGGVFAVSIP